MWRPAGPGPRGGDRGRGAPSERVQSAPGPARPRVCGSSSVLTHEPPSGSGHLPRPQRVSSSPAFSGHSRGINVFLLLLRSGARGCK